ncbi:MAG: 7-cyano-7-deazaguanine synthase QueC [Odoribacteraceae bacterium]|jgi:7-cyano-7-deazaguanine synthase|nr:7-cyano-7-deazaguanine synthase QueC [Odoribacteraceae bacterium]
MKKAIVLLSGGLDSATALYVAREEGFDELYALTFLYGQRHDRELSSARAIARAAGVKEHQVVKLPLHQWGHSALTDADAPLPEGTINPDGTPATYVPARNLVFLAVAASYADATGIADIFIGVSQVDYSGYVDCREPFIRAMEEAINAGTELGVNGGRRVRVHAPFLHASKAEEISLGRRLGVDYSLTWSCYEGGVRPCGRCDSCLLRAKAFREAGVEDIFKEPGDEDQEAV